MSITITMPKLGATMEEGKIVEWKKQQNDLIRKGDVFVIIESDKITVEYESPETGIMQKILAQEGNVFPVGTPICVFAEPGEKIEGVGVAVVQSPEGSSQAIPEPPKQVEDLAKKEEQLQAEPRVVPLVRKLATELGISLVEISGTGPGGRITKDDVLRFAERRDTRTAVGRPAVSAVSSVPKMASPGPSVPIPGIVSPGGRVVKKTIPFTGMRGAIAKRMAASFENPQGTQFMDIDISETLALRDLLKNGMERKTGVKFTLTALFVKTLVKALQEHPLLNSIIEDNQVKLIENINMGIATAVEDGLIVPVLHNLEQKSLMQIVTELSDLTERARRKKLTMADVEGGTFTLTNMGMYGSYYFTPILNPPETAILGIGTIHKKPVVIGEEIFVRPIIPFSLAFDHRAVDGAPVAQFFARLKEMLEIPCRERITDIDF